MRFKTTIIHLMQRFISLSHVRRRFHAQRLANVFLHEHAQGALVESLDLDHNRELTLIFCNY